MSSLNKLNIEIEEARKAFAQFGTYSPDKDIREQQIKQELYNLEEADYLDKKRITELKKQLEEMK